MDIELRGKVIDGKLAVLIESLIGHQTDQRSVKLNGCLFCQPRFLILFLLFFGLRFEPMSKDLSLPYSKKTYTKHEKHDTAEDHHVVLKNDSKKPNTPHTIGQFLQPAKIYTGQIGELVFHRKT